MARGRFNDPRSRAIKSALTEAIWDLKEDIDIGDRISCDDLTTPLNLIREGLRFAQNFGYLTPIEAIKYHNIIADLYQGVSSED